MRLPRTVPLLLTLALSAAGLLFLTLGASGAVEGDGAPATSASDSMLCTDPRQATNFEVFSLGGSPLDLTLAASLRRCDTPTELGEPGANYVSYIYGDCELRDAGDTGCAPPLEIQTWPACQRSLSDYSFEGSLLPHEALPSERGAQVVSFEDGMRLEVYTGASTVVVFANQPAVALKVLSLLRPAADDSPPARQAGELETSVPERLDPPDQGATEGQLSCQE